MATYDTTALVADIRRRASLPTTSASGTADADLLALANGEMVELYAAVLGVREEFFVTDKDYAITAAQAAYAIPTRAAGARLREVVKVDSAGVRTNLDKMDLEDLNSLDTTSGEPTNFYLKGNKVYLYPTPSTTTGTLRLSYLRRPNRLVTVLETMPTSAT